MDNDIHVQEPRDLWVRYVEPQFKDRAPQFTNIPDGSSPGVWRFEGKVFPAYIDRPENQQIGSGLAIQQSHIRRRKRFSEGAKPFVPECASMQSVIHARSV
jgi:hypothetical protein